MAFIQQMSNLKMSRETKNSNCTENKPKIDKCISTDLLIPSQISNSTVCQPAVFTYTVGGSESDITLYWSPDLYTEKG